MSRSKCSKGKIIHLVPRNVLLILWIFNQLPQFHQKSRDIGWNTTRISVSSLHRHFFSKITPDNKAFSQVYVLKNKRNLSGSLLISHIRQSPARRLYIPWDVPERRGLGRIAESIFDLGEVNNFFTTSWCTWIVNWCSIFSNSNLLV